MSSAVPPRTERSCGRPSGPPEVPFPRTAVDLRTALATHTWGAILALAWPAMVTGVIRVSMRTVDILVVGRVVGAVGVAAVGIADSAARLVLKLAQGLAAGTVALVAQRTGDGDRAGADTAMTHTLFFAAFLGIPAGVVGWFSADGLFTLLGADDAIRQAGAPYLRIVLASAPFRMAAMMAAKGVQAAEDTRTPMVIRTSATLVNIGLTVGLVAGVGGLPRLGVVGAAWGTAVGNAVSALAFVVVLASGRLPVGLAAPRWDRDTGLGILRIGWPQVVERVLYAAADIPLNAMLLVFGTDTNAAFQIGRRVQQYLRMPSRGFSAAAGALVGTRLGAERSERAAAFGRGSLALTTLVAATASTGAAVAAAPIARVFVDDARTVALATSWIRVLAVALVFRSVYAVLRAAYQAAGRTKLPLYATAAGLLGGRLGTSFVIGVLAGRPWGIYLGVGLDYAIRSAITSWRFRPRRWGRSPAA